MNRAAFFAELRKPNSGVFSTSLTQPQVTGIESILDAGTHLHITELAYVLATGYHETGQKMVPVVESLNYSVQGLLNTFSRTRISAAQAQRLGRDDKTGRPADQAGIANTVYGGEWGEKNLGNTLPNDGWVYRGRGSVQITGRLNYGRASKKLNIDLLASPERALEPAVSAQILVAGCTEGWFTGKRLSDYLPNDYVNARRVVNGTDRANEIAGYARAFERALTIAGFVPSFPKPEPKPEDVPQPEPIVLEPPLEQPAPQVDPVQNVLRLITNIINKLLGRA